MNQAYQLLSSLGLKTILDKVLVSKFPYYEIARSYVSDLYQTGCRSNEPLAIKNWKYINKEYVSLQPFKNNQERTIRIGDLSESLVIAIKYQRAPYDGLTLRQLTETYYKVLPVLELRTQDKELGMYVFRYNKVRMLVNANYTYPQIAEIMGWFSLGMVHSYATKDLYVRLR